MPGHRREYDGQFAITSVGFALTDPRLDGLTGGQKWVNHILWCLCVKERSETLPAYYYPPNPRRPGHHDCSTIARCTREDPRTIEHCLAKLQQKRLIDVAPDGRITVYGVRAKHPNLKWREGDLADAKGSFSVAQTETETETEAEAEATAPDFVQKIISVLSSIDANNYRTLKPSLGWTRDLNAASSRLGSQARMVQEAEKFRTWFEGQLESGKIRRDGRHVPRQRFVLNWLGRCKPDDGNGSQPTAPFICPKCAGSGWMDTSTGKECLHCHQIVPH